MEESFNIHLISNVSQNTYPKNSPSQFTTLLSNEVALNDQGWEVGVHDIMYPSELTVEKDEDIITKFYMGSDMRKLFPHNKNPYRKYLGDGEYITPHNVDANKRLRPWTTNVGTQFKTKYSPIVKMKGEGQRVEIMINPEQEKKFLVPNFLPSTSEEYSKFCVYYKKTKKPDLYKKQIAFIGESICKDLNDMNFFVRKTIEFKFDTKKRKFSVVVKSEDVLVMMTNDLAMFLGFPALTSFFQGTTEAPTNFELNFHEKIKSTAKLFFLDVRNMQTETIAANAPCNKPRDRHAISFDIPFSIDKSKLSTEALESIPNDYKFQLKLNLKHKRFVLSTKTPLRAEHRQHYETFILFTLDDTTAAKYGFQKYYVFEYNFDGHKRKLAGKFNKLRNYLQVNNVKMPTLSMKQIKDIRQSEPKLVIYKLQAKKFAINYTRIQKEIITFVGGSNMDLGRSVQGSTMIVFNEGKQRFQIVVPKDYAVKLSPSLAWKLGFTRSCVAEQCDYLMGAVFADHFPIIDRQVHELYIYSNLVDTSYVGDIQAPLLLICPFHRSFESSLTRLEFQNITYKKLNRNTFQQIEIGIFDAYGKPINFKFGRTVINLHFRKVT